VHVRSYGGADPLAGLGMGSHSSLAYALSGQDCVDDGVYAPSGTLRRDRAHRLGRPRGRAAASRGEGLSSRWMGADPAAILVLARSKAGVDRLKPRDRGDSRRVDAATEGTVGPERDVGCILDRAGASSELHANTVIGTG
jgi:hypothetical protein